MGNIKNRRKHQLSENYKLSPYQYNKLLKAQDGVCAICKRPPSGEKFLCVDHDHKCCDKKKTCGKCIRLLLCLTCNAHLGWYERNIEAVNEYLSLEFTIPEDLPSSVKMMCARGLHKWIPENIRKHGKYESCRPCHNSDEANRYHKGKKRSYAG